MHYSTISIPNYERANTIPQSPRHLRHLHVLSTSSTHCQVRTQPSTVISIPISFFSFSCYGEANEMYRRALKVLEKALGFNTHDVLTAGMCLLHLEVLLQLREKKAL